MATMEEIAKALGVSKGTVSKALSGAKDVGEATRQAVMEKALEMGYSRALRKVNAPKSRCLLPILNICSRMTLAMIWWPASAEPPKLPALPWTPFP